MARRIPGKACRMSQMRISRSSTIPPRDPANVPTANPTATEMPTTSVPTHKETRAP